MKYFYYPGCTLEGSSIEYNSSTQALMRALGTELIELEDWTCCGASAAEATSYLLSLVLPARNLALAERMHVDADVLIPCSACYLTFQRVHEHTGRNDRLLEKVNEALGVENLSYGRRLRTRHLLDVLAEDLGPEGIRPKVKRKLSGLRVAPYYGCQCLRPYSAFDDPEHPESMEPLIEAVGAEVYPWAMGAKCCGAGLATTKKEVALELVSGLLTAAEGADCIVTVCPMCQMNLENYQKEISHLRGRDLHISVLYLPQLLGIALELPGSALNLNLNLAFSESLRTRLNV